MSAAIHADLESSFFDCPVKASPVNCQPWSVLEGPRRGRHYLLSAALSQERFNQVITTTGA